jgi:hypothetical protein
VKNANCEAPQHAIFSILLLPISRLQHSPEPFVLQDSQSVGLDKYQHCAVAFAEVQECILNASITAEHCNLEAAPQLADIFILAFRVPASQLVTP